MAIIAEDDAYLRPDHDARLANILQYLEAHTGAWDVFSGFIADVSPDVKIARTEDFGGDTFVWLDRAVSMVFNIYSAKAITALSEWEATSSPDATGNTFDRFMERSRLRFVTTTPFLVGHAENLHSTLWGIPNSGYAPVIDRGAATLAGKLLDLASQRDRLEDENNAG
jgi:hypothetical protein